MRMKIFAQIPLIIGLALIVSSCVGQVYALPGASGSATSTPAPTMAPPSATPGDIVPGIIPEGTGLPPVTLENNGKMITMQANQSFLLKLGEGYDWTITVGDENVVSREVNVTVIRGAQGIYLAHRAGSTTLEAIGDPLCRQSKPACGMPSISFKINIVVH